MADDRDDGLERARAAAALAEAESRARVVPPAALEVSAEPDGVEPSPAADAALGDPLPGRGAADAPLADGGAPAKAASGESTALATEDVEPSADADVALGDPLDGDDDAARLTAASAAARVGANQQHPPSSEEQQATQAEPAEEAAALVAAEEQAQGGALAEPAQAGAAAGTSAAGEAENSAAAEENKALAIHHIGVAVGSIDEAMRFYGNVLGLEVADRIDMPERSLRVAFVRTGNTLIELLEPMNSESTVARFIERRGPGLHHLCFGTPDIAAHLRDLKDKGVDLIDETARPGAHGDVAFLAPAAAYGVLVELLQELPPETLAKREDPRPY